MAQWSVLVNVLCDPEKKVCLLLLNEVIYRCQIPLTYGAAQFSYIPTHFLLLGLPILTEGY